MRHRQFYPRDSKANTVLVLGVISVAALGFITGIPAWIMGMTELRHMKSGLTDPIERSYAQTGLVLGIVGTVFSLAWLIWILTDLDL